MVEDKLIREGVFKMRNRDASYYIEHLNMEQHPEGGHFARSYYSDEKMNNFWNKTRNLYTTIYFCLKSGEVPIYTDFNQTNCGFSMMEVHSRSTSFSLMVNIQAHKLGLNLIKGKSHKSSFQKERYSVRQLIKESFSLVGCMVSPGFDFEDFELFTQEELLNYILNIEEIIKKMAYQKIVGRTHL